MDSGKRDSLRRSAVWAALMLLAATASGCGVGLPTQPDINQAAREHGASASRLQEMGDSLEIEDSGASGGGSDTTPGSTDVVIEPPPGSGNSDWGHSHKKPI